MGVIRKRVAVGWIVLAFLGGGLAWDQFARHFLGKLTEEAVGQWEVCQTGWERSNDALDWCLNRLNEEMYPRTMTRWLSATSHRGR